MKRAWRRGETVGEVVVRAMSGGGWVSCCLGLEGRARVLLTCCQQAAENESKHGAEEVFAAVGFALAFGGFGPFPGSLLLAFGAFLFAEGG